MKKFIFVLTALLMLSLGAFAQEINVLYNGEAIAFDDASAEIISGRVMLPFRAVLEKMGAQVDYNVADRSVTAQINEKIISFFTDGTQIFSQSGEVIYVMDVPSVIKNGRTLVPVRAVSEAAGLQVGWDSDERTVVITDTQKISDEITNIFSQLTALTSNLPEKDFFVKKETDVIYIGETKLVAESKINADSSAQSVKTEITLPCGKATLEAVITAEELLFKTDLPEKCPALFPEALIKHLPSGKWLYCDWDELEEYISGQRRGELKAAAVGLIKGDFASSWAESFKKALVPEDTESAADAVKIRKKIQALERIFAGDGIKKEHDLSTVSIKITPDEAELLTGQRALISYTGDFDSRAETDSMIVAEFNMDGLNVRLESKTQRDSASVVEKVLLPAKEVNFVDVLYSVIMDMNLT